MKDNHIIAVHLLNDLSGSPFVFRQALEALTAAGFTVHLFTATPQGQGFLLDIPGVVYHSIPYRWSKNRWLTLLFYLTNQALLFGKICWFARRCDLLYINSMLPFGAALAGRLKGSRVVYHIHEVSVRPALLRRWLIGVINHTASCCFYVSRFVQEALPIRKSGIRIFNALPEEFTRKAQAFLEAGVEKNPASMPGTPFVVLMLCSLKVYKGVLEFLACTRAMPGIQFQLVLNAREADIRRFFAGEVLPPNLSWFEAQQDVHPFYRQASVILNLSLPDQWIETFGMTILEGMYYGLPAIVPPAGGVRELVEDGVSGYCLDSRNHTALTEAIRALSENQQLYHRMSLASRNRAGQFSQVQFRQTLVLEMKKQLSLPIHEPIQINPV